MASTILQLSDIHMRADGGPVYGRDPAERLERVLDACERELAAVDLVVLAGDHSDDGESAAMSRVAKLVDRLAAPVLAIPGNHDCRRAHGEVFGDSAPIERGGWRVIGVDSSIPGEVHGTVDVSALELLLDGLDDRPTVLALHHPPLPPTGHPLFRFERAAELVASLASRPQVRALISGHVHMPFEVDVGSLRLLGGPSTLVPFDFAGDELTVGTGGPTGARVIALAEDGSLQSAVLEA